MSSPIRTFYQKDSILLGITIKDQLGIHTNPTNGVKVSVFAPDGSQMLEEDTATQARYNEHDTSTAGQFFSIAKTSDTWDTGAYRVDFLIDDAGTNPGFQRFNPFFRLASGDTTT